jgi:hypothetical protein
VNCGGSEIVQLNFMEISSTEEKKLRIWDFSAITY